MSKQTKIVNIGLTDEEYERVFKKVLEMSTKEGKMLSMSEGVRRMIGIYRAIEKE